MSAWELSDDERAAILHDDILPLLFPASGATDDPTLTLLTGQPGSGRPQAAARICAEQDGEVAILSADQLRAFHPSIAELDASGSVEAVGELRAATAEWLRAGMAFAREHHRSLLVEGSFATPAAAVATAQRFGTDGFRTRIVIAGARRAESLLSTVSLYLHGVQTGGPARFVSRDAHDRGFDGTHALAATLEESDAVNRVTVLGRAGASVFDGVSRNTDRPFVGARAALLATQSDRLTSLRSAQWLSELRRVTEYAATVRMPRPLTELLIDLHETALREVIPELPVPAGSRVVAAQERRSASDLVSLRRSLIEARPVDAAAPSVAQSGPERGGPSR
ncbi:zeta toxin family protein [Micromonospora sp. DT81.3]|uniref:zeta toxin family protein n=1 Tax=Micromonospora sp. DT81.3 TaxID=3416523 RepID=UPI003CF75055